MGHPTPHHQKWKDRVNARGLTYGQWRDIAAPKPGRLGSRTGTRGERKLAWHLGEDPLEWRKRHGAERAPA